MAAGSATDIGLEPGWRARQPPCSLVPVPDNSEKAVVSERHAACAITLPKSSMAVDANDAYVPSNGVVASSVVPASVDRSTRWWTDCVAGADGQCPLLEFRYSLLRDPLFAPLLEPREHPALGLQPLVRVVLQHLP